MFNEVNRSSPVPYYVQVKRNLENAIRGGHWQTGDQLPGEMALCEMFDVSRTVIRRALDQLVNEGFIMKEKGRGTFVAQNKISEHFVQHLIGFYEDMASQGYKPLSRILQQETLPAEPAVARKLNVNIGTPLIVIERQRFIENEPIVLVTTYIPKALCPSLLETDLTEQSLYKYLETTCQLEIARGSRIIEAVTASDYQADLLDVAEGAPLIRLESISYLSDGRALAYYEAFHRGDRSRFEVELIRK